ncbi:MAG TPA: sulfatase-like hydrolase/transferase [Thermoplasmata archaeon]|nr:sulfatase-like hydrolase/transferase [Thermoplasmata archaeon]
MSPGASPSRPAGRPDVLVVVLDCVRAASFPGTGGSGAALPVFEALRRESTVFTQAATVAPWTLPSHASLFTGRYPWEHGVLGEGRLRYEMSLPTMAGALRGAGYETLGLSANGLLYPLFAAPGSYESFRCAEWWEKTFRWIRPESLDPETARRPRSGRNALAVLARGSRTKGATTPELAFLRHEEPTASLPDAVHAARPEEAALGRRAETLSWAALDASNRLARVLRTPSDPRPLPVAPWIEPTLRAWLAQQPADRPVHCFVNLLDAHEKYLSDSALVRGVTAWWKFVRVPQNPRLWLEGEWSPTTEELALLRNLYEATLERLSRRVAELIAAFRDAGRWDNTLLILTSDHGQAFGENGDLFHERSPREPLLHVPLWVRWPKGTAPPSVRTDRVSLVDIASTVLRAAGIPEAFATSGTPLQTDGPEPRARPVLAMADGYPTIENYRRRLNGALLERLQHSYGVAYEGTMKAVVGVQEGDLRTFQLTNEPDRSAEQEFEDPVASEFVAGSAREVANELRRAAEGDVDSTVEDRLRSWGYL